jgi:hypothetical protein
LTIEGVPAPVSPMRGGDVDGDEIELGVVRDRAHPGRVDRETGGIDRPELLQMLDALAGKVAVGKTAR